MGKDKLHSQRHISAPVPPRLCFNGQNQAVDPSHPSPYYDTMSASSPYNQNAFYYQPTPPPQTVVVHQTPSRSKDACCWGCLAALCLCFASEECC
ncbi:uncharacterized protein BYT42DRAFT_641749 [Radiomyces spectabilis]|uniref:uncharacterized protein n=1 Tax=Radiomyces spectabilis TaxID=64574 RepID=UPI00221F5714|nr:uncharacterized protein BYT42DRAFT_641749 [Radiomyces spectabilis]KAI8391238.1 hypothetical protein BYT42DRAFT_641749 [Radiomyces spectabilis]